MTHTEHLLPDPWARGVASSETGGVIAVPSDPLLLAAGFLFLLLLAPKPAVFSRSKCGVCGKRFFLQEALPLPSPSWLPTNGSLSFYLPPHRLGFSLDTPIQKMKVSYLLESLNFLMTLMVKVLKCHRFLSHFVLHSPIKYF